VSLGLLAPLSPQEEIALRRIAHGSFVTDERITRRLRSLALVEFAHSALRLTPLGLLRFNALAQAPLLRARGSMQAVSGYVEGLIEKAQDRLNLSASRPARTPANATIGEGATPSEEAVEPKPAGALPDANTPTDVGRDVIELRRTMRESRERYAELHGESLRRIGLRDRC
jgi:hypothetical protein